MDEPYRKIMLRTFVNENVSEEKFKEIMRIDSGTIFRITNSNSLSYFEGKFSKNGFPPIFLYFFETDQHGNFIVGENEEDFKWETPGGEELDGGDYMDWWVEKFDERIQLATEWLSSRQDFISQLQQLDMQIVLYIKTASNQDYFELPASFISVCGKLNLPFIFDHNYY